MSRLPSSKKTVRPGQSEKQEEEYGFRFSLCPDSQPTVLNLREMLAVHLRELLDIVTPTSGGRGLRIDGFSLLSNPDAVYGLYPSENGDLSGAKDLADIYEPRIKYIQRVLQALLALIDLEVRGKKVEVDGFRLRNLEQWLAPGGGASDIVAHAATRCNLDCRFCYVKGTPPALRPVCREPDEEYAEILTRIQHYVPGSGLSLFPNAGSPCEPLAHPRILDILKALRRKTPEPLRIPTNGSLLSPKMILSLADLQPVFVDVSLNTASPGRRRWLMRDPRPQIASASLAGLRGAGIPYSMVIVPWPFPSLQVMLDDLKKTVAFGDQFDPAFIQISLPGYSRFFSEEPLFSTEQVWNEVRAAVQQLRVTTRCPVILRPGLFEEYLEPERVKVPQVIGSIMNSPAQRAGLRCGDTILKVGGIPVRSRAQARSVLKTLHRSDLKRSSMIISRNGRELPLQLELGNYAYPYDPLTAPLLGSVFPSSGIPPGWLDQLRTVISLREASEVLLLTSRLVRPALEKELGETLSLSGVRIHLRVPNNRFLGGNIFMGDLMVVEDFVEAVLDFLKKGKARPDLVVIPSTPFHLSGWGRDLTGRVYLEIERSTGVPVALVECAPVFD